MIRIGIFALFAFLFVFVTFASHVYQIVNQPLWDRSFRDYIRCDANITILEKLNEEINDPAAPASGGCVIKHRPNIAVMKLHLFAMFGTGIVMSTWVWTKASFLNWRRAWFKLIGRSDNEMKRIRHRSRMIAKAFANRHALRLGRKKDTNDANNGSDNAGFDPADLEFSEHTLTHQDPVGMDFDLNSVSQELSSNWVRNVPKMVRRRGAIMPQAVSSSPTTPEPTVQPPRGQEARQINTEDPNIIISRHHPQLATARPPLGSSNNSSVQSSVRSTWQNTLFNPMAVDQSLPGFVGVANPPGDFMGVIEPQQIPISVSVSQSPQSSVSRPAPSRLPPIRSRRSRPGTSTRGATGQSISMAQRTPTNATLTKLAW